MIGEVGFKRRINSCLLAESPVRDPTILCVTLDKTATLPRPLLEILLQFFKLYESDLVTLHYRLCTGITLKRCASRPNKCNLCSWMRHRRT